MANLRAHITWLETQLGNTDRTLRARIEASPLWRVRDQLLQSAPGIGPATAARLLASVRELGRLTHRQISKLVGVGPLNDDSGRRSGPRRIRGGRTEVRSALYMATVGPSATIRQSAPAISAGGRRANSRRSPSWPTCISCSFISMPSSDRKRRGVGRS